MSASVRGTTCYFGTAGQSQQTFSEENPKLQSDPQTLSPEPENLYMGFHKLWDHLSRSSYKNTEHKDYGIVGSILQADESSE